ncbi:MAG: CBS domain-containing protein [Deltaproteobacteria bacterium]|nr:CBS domain-containing protein [Deltaproteobacteria bacterium]
MFVKKFMSSEVVTVSEKAGIVEALGLLKEHAIRHLPVVEDEQLVGLVTENDLHGAVFPAMLEEITVKDVMNSRPVTVDIDAPLEEAARLIYHHKVGGLPVVDKADNLKGIITMVDMLLALIDLMGFISTNSRLDLILPDRPNAFEEAIRVIQENGGRIINVSMTRQNDDQQIHLFRLEKINLDPIVDKLNALDYEVVSRLD